MQRIRRITVSFLTLIMILSVAFVPIRTCAEGTVRIDFSNRHPSAGSNVNIRVWDLNGATQTITVAYDPGLLTITGASTSYSGGNGSVTLTGSNVYLYMKANAAGRSPVKVYINGVQAQSAPLTIGKSQEELQQEKAAKEQAEAAAAQKKAEEDAAAQKAAEAAAAQQAAEAAAAQQAAEAAAKRIGDDNYYVEVAAPQSVPVDSMKSVKLVIGDRQFDAYQIDDDSSNDTSIYYIYGTDKNGTTGWFKYNAADQKIEAVDMDALAKSIKEKEEKEAAEKKAEEQNATEKEQASETAPNEEKAEDKGFLSKISDKKVLIAAALAVIVILLIIILAVKAGKKKSSSNEKESGHKHNKKDKRRKNIPAKKDDNGYAPLDEEPADYEKEYKNSVYRSLLENEEGGSGNSYDRGDEILPTVESVQAEREARAAEYMSDASNSVPETGAVESEPNAAAVSEPSADPDQNSLETSADETEEPTPSSQQELNIFEPVDSEANDAENSEPELTSEPAAEITEPETGITEPAAEITEPAAEPYETNESPEPVTDNIQSVQAAEPAEAAGTVSDTPAAFDTTAETSAASESAARRKPKKRRFRHRVDDFWDYTGNDDEEYVEAEKRREAEKQAREEAERQAREEAERQAREEAERQAREEAERQAREEAERQAREESERQAREEAERQAREEAERQAREEAERQAREEAERQAREEEERQAREEAERQAREEAERQAREEAERALLDDMPPVYTDTKLPDYRPHITPQADVTENTKPETEESETLESSSESAQDENELNQQETKDTSGSKDNKNNKSSSDSWSDDDDFIDLNDF